MKNIQVCGQNLLMLLNNVLDLARIENDKTEMEYSVSDVEKDFRNCIAMFRNQADSKNQTLTVTTHLLHPYIYADIPHLTEVCTNLVSNAVKYTGARGTIRCDVTQKPGEKAGWCDTVITVADNGIGMSQEFQQRIFEPFERERTSTVSKVEGSGIGMGIVKKLVGLMGGTVEVESKIGVGSTFTVTIPSRIASAGGSTGETRDQLPRTKRACAVYKNPADRGQRPQCGDRRRAAAGGRLRGRPRKRRRGMRGYAGKGGERNVPADPYGYPDARDERLRCGKKDTAGWTTPKRRGIPIVAMTANAFSEDRQAALDAGMNDHVAKPIDMNMSLCRPCGNTFDADRKSSCRRTTHQTAAQPDKRIPPRTLPILGRCPRRLF